MCAMGPEPGGLGSWGGAQTPQTTPDLSSEKWSSWQQRPCCVPRSQTKRVPPPNRNCDTSKLQNSSQLKNGSAGVRPQMLPYRERATKDRLQALTLARGPPDSGLRTEAAGPQGIKLPTKAARRVS